MRRLCASIFSVLILFAGCGTDEAGAPPGGGEPGAGEPAPADTPAGYGTVSIAIEGDEIPTSAVVATLRIFKAEPDSQIFGGFLH